MSDPRDTDFSEKFIKAFRPLYILLNVVGQLPFEIYEQAEDTFGFRFRKFGFRSVLFVITFTTYIIAYILFSFGLFCDFFEIVIFQKAPLYLELENSYFTTEPAKNVTWEQVMLANHKGVIYTSYALFWTTLFGNLHILFYGKTHIHYFNYWNKVVQVTRIDPSTGIDKFYMGQFGFCLVQILLDLIFFTLFNGFRAMAGVYACYLLRLFVEAPPSKPWFFIVQVLVMLFLLYGHIGTRAIVIQFIFFCFLLRNMANEWNRRLRRALSTYMKRATSELKKNREDFRSILRDHLIIVQLFKMTDVTFALILKIYYGTQVCCIMLQMIHFWKLVGYIPVVAESNATDATTTTISPDVINFRSRNEFSEGILIIALCLMTIAIFSLVSKTAHFANTEAMLGFELVRRRGLMNCETKAERNFLYTLIVSFARNNPITLTVDGYSILNKAMTLGMLATISGLIIHFIQYEVEKYSLRLEDYRHQYPPPIY